MFSNGKTTESRHLLPFGLIYSAHTATCLFPLLIKETFLVWLFAEERACVWMIFQRLVQSPERCIPLKLTPLFPRHGVGGLPFDGGSLVTPRLPCPINCMARLRGLRILRTFSYIAFGLNHYSQGFGCVWSAPPSISACARP